jgi:pimeloyl-ACP methyl ester carboxylesterase
VARRGEAPAKRWSRQAVTLFLVRFAESRSVRVAYDVAGQGPGLVLVPGTGGSGESVWGHLAGRFADSWTVVTPDLEGAGQTTFRDRPLELEDLIGQVTAVAADAELAEFDLVGYSLGTAVAAGLAADRGDLVSSLVLVAGVVACDARMRLQLELWRDLFDRDPESLARVLVQSAFSTSFLSAMSRDEVEAAIENFVATMPVGFRRHSELGMDIDLHDVCRQIRTRTLVIGLTRDQITPVEQTRALHHAIPGSAYAEIDSGHLVVFERPEELVVRVREFISNDAP